MNPAWAITLTFLIPAVPWIGFSPWWVSRRSSAWALLGLFVAGIILDLWWGKPLGGLSLLLLLLVVVQRKLGELWPADQRTLLIVFVIVSLLLLEVYLAL